MSGADKLIGRKSNAVQDQLRPIGIVDEGDPLYDSESEDENCFYSVMDVLAADEYRQGLNRQTSYSGSASASPSKKESYKEYLVKVNAILAEYGSGGSVNAICDAVADLSEQFGSQQHDLFVLTAIRHALDQPTTNKQLNICGVLSVLFTRKLVTTQHISRALEKLIQAAHDIQFDVPNVYERLLVFIECLREDGCIDASFADRLPEEFLAAVADKEEFLKWKEPLQRLRDFKSKVRGFESDFFNSRDMDEVAQALKEFGNPTLRHEFVRLMVAASLEKTDHHRELVSNCFDLSYGKVLVPHDIQLGLSRVIGAVDELALDTPNVEDLLAKYLARSIVDEIIPPSFILDNYRLHIGGKPGMSVLKKTQKWFSQSKGKAKAIQFRKVWTGSDPQTRECREFKHEIKDCIVEYLDSGDVREAVRLIGNMDLTPDQCSETVRKIIVYSMERGVKATQCDVAIKLLRELVDSAEFSPRSVTRGFHQTHLLMQEITLDVPDVTEQLKTYKAAAEKQQLILDRVDAESDPGDLFG